MYSYYQHLKPNLCEVGGVKFTVREIDILACLLHGRGSKKIAGVLTISPKTAEAHIRNIMLKLDCNSRESIIDFLEKSNELGDLNLHYFKLIKANLFTQQLSEISKQNLTPRKLCHLIYDSEDPAHVDFFKELEVHLKLAGIKCLLNPPKDVSREEGPDVLTLFAVSNVEAAKPWKPTYTLALPTSNKPGEIEDSTTLDFTDDEKGIASFFTLLKEFYPQLDPQECIGKLCIYSEDIHTATTSIQRTRHPIVKGILTNRYAHYAALGFLVLAPILIFKGIVHLSWTTSSTPVRSELPIPNHATLLERPDHLKELKQKLGQDPDGIRVVAVTGIGGSGKSTLARQFGKQNDSKVIWEINADSTTSIARSFESLAYALAQSREDKEELEAINDLKESESAERDRQLLYFVKRHLKAKRDWLLIYDNLESFAVAHNYFPHDKTSWGNGKVIITTRNENLKNSSYLGTDNLLTVSELDESEKASLYQAILKDDASASLNPGTKEFLQHIPPFPLDVSICAYYLKNTEISPESYLNYIEKSGEKFSAIQKRLLTDVSDYTKTRYGIITLSLSNLLESHPEFLKPLLFISLIGNQNIPSYLLTHIQAEMTANDFIYNLKNFSLITPNPSPINSFSIHASTQKIMLSFLEKRDILTKDPKTLEGVARGFIESLKEAGDSKDAIKMRALITHGEQFVTHIHLFPALLQGEVYGQLGRIYYYLGHFEEAKPHFIKGTKILQTHFGPDHPKVAWITTYLGKVYRNQGHYKTAEAYLKRSFQIYKKRLTKYPLKYAWVGAHLGNIYRNLGHFEKGEQHLRESLAIHREHLGLHDIHSAWVSVHLANILRGQKKHTEAYNLIQSNYPIFREHYGDSHALTSWVHACLGRVLIDLGSFDEAQEILETSLRTYRKFFGEDHIQTSWVLRGLGRLYIAKGEAQKAKTCVEESLHILQKRDHPDTYISLELMAKLPEIENKDKENPNSQGQAYLQEALQIVQNHFPENSPHAKRISHKLEGK